VAARDTFPGDFCGLALGWWYLRALGRWLVGVTGVCSRGSLEDDAPTGDRTGLVRTAVLWKVSLLAVEKTRRRTLGEDKGGTVCFA
jgi:hypothetical protein